MLHRSIKLAYVAIALFSAAVGILVLQNSDEDIVAGPSTILRIDESDEVAGGPQVTAMLESFAREQGVNIGRQVDDLERPESLRHLYLAVGDPYAESAAWLRDGYPGFSPAISTEMRPLGEISTRDPRGYYLLFGPQQAADDLLPRFAELGLRGSQQPYLTPSRAIELFGHGALLLAVAAVAAAAVAIVASGVILSSTAYGVRRLHGHSFGRILAEDMWATGRYLLGVVAVVGAAVAVFLVLYNGLNQFGRYSLIAVGFLVFFTALAASAHLSALALVHRTGILDSVKGRVPAGPVISSSYAIRVPALLLTLAAATAVLAGGSRAIDQRAEFATWSATGDAATVLLNGSLTGREEEMTGTVGEWIRRSSDAGEVILTEREPPDAVFLPDSGVSVTELLIVNTTYLREQPLLDPAGRPVVGPDPGTDAVQVLVPERYRADSDRIGVSVDEWIGFQVRDRAGAAPEVAIVPLRSGQSPFAYDTATYLDRPTRPVDPVVIAIPDGSDVLADEQYAAYATQGGVVFRDGGQVVSELAQDEELATYVLAVSPVAQKAATEYRDVVRDLRLRVFNLAAAAAVLVITAVGVALVYGRRNADALFVKYVSGWSFVRAYGPLLAVELALSLLLVGWAAWAGPPESPGGTPVTDAVGSGWEPVVAGAIGVASLTFVVLSLLRFNRRMVTEHRSEA